MSREWCRLDTSGDERSEATAPPAGQVPDQGHASDSARHETDNQALVAVTIIRYASRACRRTTVGPSSSQVVDCNGVRAKESYDQARRNHLSKQRSSNVHNPSFN